MGIVHLRDTLVVAASDKANIDIRYMGAPRYAMEVSASDYKTAEEEMKRAFQEISTKLHSYGGRAKLVREAK